MDERDRQASHLSHQITSAEPWVVLLASYGLVAVGAFLIEVWRMVDFSRALDLSWESFVSMAAGWLGFAMPGLALSAAALGSFLGWANLSKRVEQGRRGDRLPVENPRTMAPIALLIVVTSLALGVALVWAPKAEVGLAGLKLELFGEGKSAMGKGHGGEDATTERKSLRDSKETIGDRQDGRAARMAGFVWQERWVWALFPLVLAWLGWETGRAWPGMAFGTLLLLTLLVAMGLSLWGELARYLWRGSMPYLWLPWLSFGVVVAAAAYLRVCRPLRVASK